MYKQDRFTTCFKTCGTGSLFRGWSGGSKSLWCHSCADCYIASYACMMLRRKNIPAGFSGIKSQKMAIEQAQMRWIWWTCLLMRIRWIIEKSAKNSAGIFRFFWYRLIAWFYTACVFFDYSTQWPIASRPICSRPTLKTLKTLKY